MDNPITLESFWDCDKCDENYIKLKEDFPYCPRHGTFHHDYADSRLNEVLSVILKMVEEGSIAEATKWVIAVGKDLEERGRLK